MTFNYIDNFIFVHICICAYKIGLIRSGFGGGYIAPLYYYAIAFYVVFNFGLFKTRNYTRMIIYTKTI